MAVAVAVTAAGADTGSLAGWQLWHQGYHPGWMLLLLLRYAKLLVLSQVHIRGGNPSGTHKKSVLLLFSLINFQILF